MNKCYTHSFPIHTQITYKDELSSSIQMDVLINSSQNEDKKYQFYIYYDHVYDQGMKN